MIVTLIILILLGIASRFMPSPLSLIVIWGVGIVGLLVLLALLGVITLPWGSPALAALAFSPVV